MSVGLAQSKRSLRASTSEACARLRVNFNLDASGSFEKQIAYMSPI